MAETSIVFVTQQTTTEIRFDTVTTQTPPTGRIVEGIHFYGTEGRTVIGADDGAIPAGTGAQDGAGAKTLPKGVQHGTVAHLGSVNFAEPYENTPLVVYAGGGLSMEQRALWGTTAEVDADTATDAAPTSSGIYQVPVFAVDASGFTAFLYLRDSATVTGESGPLAGPTTLHGTGTTGFASPSSGLPALDNTYRCNYTLDIETIKSGQALVEVALEARVDGGPWSEIASATESHSFPVGGGRWVSEGSLSGAISGMDGSGSDDFRCRVKSISSPSGSNDSREVTFGPNVTWSTSTSSYASMTPESGDEAAFVVTGSTKNV